jgi:hypothetical protein
MSLGLGGGGGSGYFALSGSVGRFLVDRFQASLGVSYQYQDFGNANAQQVRGNLSLRYYLMDTDPISPFVVGDVGTVRLIHSGDGLEESFTYYSTAAGVGGNMRLGGNLALEFVIGGIQYLGVEQLLFDREVVKEGINLWWNIGLQVGF